MTALQRRFLFSARTWLCVGFGLSPSTYSIARAPTSTTALAPRSVPTKPATDSVRASPVISPLGAGGTGPAVASLQDALLLLLERKLIQAFDAPNRPTQADLQSLTASLNQERAQGLFGQATQQLVRYFQVQQGLGDTLGGAIDDATAAKFNELLQAIGATAVPPTSTSTGSPGPLNPAPAPLYSLSLKAGDNGPSIASLQDALLVLLGRNIIQAFDAPNRPTQVELRALIASLKQERSAGFFSSATQQLVGYFQVQQGLGETAPGVVDEKTAARLNELLIALETPAQTGAASTLRKRTDTAETPPASANSRGTVDRRN
jgi:peptidoglycan hydrolase-like protein with peptidoglycan-binding domain